MPPPSSAVRLDRPVRAGRFRLPELRSAHAHLLLFLALDTRLSLRAARWRRDNRSLILLEEWPTVPFRRGVTRTLCFKMSGNDQGHAACALLGPSTLLHVSAAPQ